MVSDQKTDSTAVTMNLSQALGRLLENAGMTIGTAESCTGGLVASAITDVAGSSVWFERGVVTYSNSAKQAMLGVDPVIFEQHGAVSKACVAAMAVGAINEFGVDVAISVSGIAGPGGASPGKPVGTVWIGWAVRPASTMVDTSSDGSVTSGTIVDTAVFLFSGDRLQVREQAVHEALRGTILRMDNTHNIGA